MKQFVNFTAIVAIMVLVFTGLAFASSPQLVNYQGQQVDGSGDPEHGTFNIKFSLFEADSDNLQSNCVRSINR